MGARQQFERGFAEWGPSNMGPYIIFRSDEGRWDAWPDTWKEGQPEFACAKSETGAYGPRRGFGKLWCEHELWRYLGEATGPEEATGALSFEIWPEGYIDVKREGGSIRLMASDRGFEEPQPKLDLESQVRARVGVHGRNDPGWRIGDFEALRTMRCEAVKLMSFTDESVLQQLRKSFGDDLLIVCRLYVGGAFGEGERRPSTEDFFHWAEPVIRLFARYGCIHFEIHNEPNHLEGIEGWGQEDHHARDFNVWFHNAFTRLKEAFPGGLFGFPGLAIPHRDLEWLEICREAVEMADWLGIHCYWQSPEPGISINHLDGFWGLRYREYFKRFPDKQVFITEYGNSNTQSKQGWPVDWPSIADEYVEWHYEVFQEPRIKATFGFILSAPQKEWDGFAWVSESGDIREPPQALGKMVRRPLYYDPGGSTTTTTTTTTLPYEPTDRHLLYLPEAKIPVHLNFVRFGKPLGQGMELHIAEPSAVYEIGDREIVVQGTTVIDISEADARVFVARWRELGG